MKLTPIKMAQALWSAFGRIKSIPHDDPDLTPANWCTAQPCIKIRIASRAITVSQPTSTFFVYFLGLLTIGVGLYFFRIQDGQTSRLWWGISLLLWGVGAILAGTSYQAFGYEIKCAGRRFCSWTSWWEVIYLIFQQVSINAMLVAVAHSCTVGPFKTLLLGYAIVSSLVYIILIFAGGMAPIKSLITFELMVWFSTPVFLFFLFLNAWRYHVYGDPMDLVLLVAWILLLITMAMYWIYDRQAVGKKLWKKGIWFSENDVLHILLILWMIYIATMLAGRVRDYSAPVLQG